MLIYGVVQLLVTHSCLPLITLTCTQTLLPTRTPESIRLDSSGSDPAVGAAILEVGLNNPILEAGFEIISSPTSKPTSLSSIKETLQVCQVELHPFFIYGHDGRTPLSAQVRGAESLE